jgi:hypothetical protein
MPEVTSTNALTGLWNQLSHQMRQPWLPSSHSCMTQEIVNRQQCALRAWSSGNEVASSGLTWSALSGQLKMNIKQIWEIQGANPSRTIKRRLLMIVNKCKNNFMRIKCLLLTKCHKKWLVLTIVEGIEKLRQVGYFANYSQDLRCVYNLSKYLSTQILSTSKPTKMNWRTKDENIPFVWEIHGPMWQHL